MKLVELPDAPSSWNQIQPAWKVLSSIVIDGGRAESKRPGWE
jgi:hypothetical protein